MASEQIKEICDRLLKMFESGEFPPAAARTVIARAAGDKGIPSARWSMCNQLIMLLSGTEDARGFRQWLEVSRHVTKGAKAIYILVPLTRKITMTIVDAAGETTEHTQHQIKGFRTAPVFRYEDTEGAPLVTPGYMPPQLPPLFNVAQHFGMVRYAPLTGNALGSCSQTGTITLHSYDLDVFFHELAHQVHATIYPLKPGQDMDQELVAEMVSCTLCELYGLEGYHWQGWRYMMHYGSEDPIKTLKSINAVLRQVEQVIMRILEVDKALLAEPSEE